MTFPARIRAASLIFGALLLTVLVSDVAGLPGCVNGCKTATASAAAGLDASEATANTRAARLLRPIDGP